MSMSNQSKIVGTRYVLAVKDLIKSADYYKNQLGFTSLWNDDGWHFLNREKFVVMLGECPNDQSAFETMNHSYFAYIDVESIDELHQEYISKGVDVLSELENKLWGQREFSIRTIDGHRIMFGEQMKELEFNGQR
jgi:catechol 2,3-dioxygenase-like lactoylglutathione lyase family enzyme